MGFTPLVAEVFLGPVFLSPRPVSLWCRLRSGGRAAPLPGAFALFSSRSPRVPDGEVRPWGGEVSSVAEVFLSLRKEVILHF